MYLISIILTTSTIMFNTNFIPTNNNNNSSTCNSSSITFSNRNSNKCSFSNNSCNNKINSSKILSRVKKTIRMVHWIFCLCINDLNYQYYI